MGNWCGTQEAARSTASTPIYGKLSFLDRQGNPASSGINVGDVWTFRSYIEGSTKAAAICILFSTPAASRARSAARSFSCRPPKPPLLMTST